MKQEKAEKEMMKHLGSSFSSLLHCRYPRWLFATTYGGATLIPRQVNHIKVFGIYTDIRMDAGRRAQQQHRPSATAGPSTSRHPHLGAELHRAASRGDMNGVKVAMQRKNGEEMMLSKDGEGNVALHLAVKNGHMDVASHLVKKCPQGCYQLNRDKISPVYLAVTGRHTALLHLMLTALGNDANIVPKLMEGKPTVHAAIEVKNKEMVQTILKRQPELIKSKDEQGRRPLSYAAYMGNVELVEFFLKHFPESISIKDSDRYRSYPIHKACQGGHVEVLKMFYSASKKSLLSKDQRGQNILHLAAKQPNNRLKHVVSYLLNLDAEISRKLHSQEDEKGAKPLTLAIDSQNDEVAQLITRLMKVTQ